MSVYKSFRVEMFQDVAIVTVQAGDLWDRAEIHRLQDELLEYVQSEAPAKMILDMASVGRVSSEALNALIRLRDQEAARNAELRLCSLQKPVKEVLRITELGRLFQIYDSLPEAFRGFAEEGV
jgi:anti-anti-sigma factor